MGDSKTRIQQGDAWARREKAQEDQYFEDENRRALEEYRKKQDEKNAGKKNGVPSGDNL